MSLRNLVAQLWKSKVESDSIVYASGPIATPASGAPGAYAKLLANATATTAWWAVGVDFGNASGAGAAAFTYQIARAEDGSGTSIANTINVLLEATTAVVNLYKALPYPVRVAAGLGAAARQTTAAGKTLDVCLFYATGVGT